VSEFINPHTGEISWHKGGRGQTPNGKSYQEFLAHDTAQYRMTFAQWEANRLKKYKPKKDTKAYEVKLERSDWQAVRAAYGPYKPETEGKWEPYAKELVAIAELQFEIRALVGSTKNMLFARASGLKSMICQAVKHKRDVDTILLKVTVMLEQIQIDFVKYEGRLKKQSDSKHPDKALKANTQLTQRLNYKCRFATSGQKLARLAKQ
jgi:hypothetical protein